MGEFETLLAAACANFDATFGPNATSGVDPAIALAKLVSLLCLFLELFLTIHPYANGNGHCGRLIVWIILVRYGFIPTNWPLDAKPPAPAYAKAISAYRDKNKLPLETLLMQCIQGPPP
jgi:hypothetical protein